TDVRTSIERDDACFVNHLVTNDDVSWRLYDLVAEIVEGRQHAGDEPTRDAAAVNVEVFPRVHFIWEMLARTKTTPEALNVLLGLRSHCRNPPVRRIHNKRCLTIRLSVLNPVGWRIDREALVARLEFLSVGFRLAFRLALAL